MPLSQKENMIDQTMIKFTRNADPEEEIVHDPFTLDLKMEDAIRLIQKNERGRQGRSRYLDLLKRVYSQFEKNRIKDSKTGGQTTQNEKDKLASEFVQRRIRGILARKHIESMR